MRRALGFVGGMLAALALALLMAPTGGFPSRPRFQAVGVGTAAPASDGALTAAGAILGQGNSIQIDGISPRYCFNETDAAADEKGWMLVPAGGVLTLYANVDANLCSTTGAAVAMTWLRTAAALQDVRVQGVSILPESGTFTANFTAACTTTPTATFDYQKVGNIVSLVITGTNGFPCTGDATTFDTVGAALPASITPAFGGATGATGAVLTQFLDNGAAAWAELHVNTDGSLQFSKCAAFGANCSTGGWTASGNRSAPCCRVMTYMLGNP